MFAPCNDHQGVSEKKKKKNTKKFVKGQQKIWQYLAKNLLMKDMIYSGKHRVREDGDDFGRIANLAENRRGFDWKSFGISLSFTKLV